MSTTIEAVFVGGVLRPVQPLALDEGEMVELNVARKKLAGQARRTPAPEEEDYARRLKAAKSLDEMHAVMKTAPLSHNDTFDLVGTINESRRLTGFRMPDPDPAGEAPA